MKRFLIPLVLVSLAACSQAPAPTENPTALAPERVGTKSFDYGVGVAVDKQRNAVYAVVSTDGSLTGKNLGGRDTFLQRYKRNGEIVWSRQFGSPDSDYVTDIAVDETRGFVYVVRKRFTNGDGTGEKVSFLYKYSANGKQLLKHKVEYDNQTELSVDVVMVDNRGYVYVGGGGDYQTSGGGFGFIQKLRGNGTVLWEDNIGQEDGGIEVLALTTDNARNVYVSVTAGDDFIYSVIHKFSAAGTELFYINGGPDGPDEYNVTYANDLVVEGNSLYATGYRNGTPYQCCSDYPELPNEGFFLKFSLNGDLEQKQTLKGEWYPSALSTDGNKNIFMTGKVTQNGKDSDPFLRKYNSQSRIQWTKRFGSTKFDGGNDVAAYNSGEIYVIGSTQGAIGGGKNRGGEDAFVSRLNGSGKLIWTDQ